MSEMPDELKPCPFCGSHAQLRRTKDIAQWWYGECVKCYTRNLASSTKEEAAKFWNSRV